MFFFQSLFAGFCWISQVLSVFSNGFRWGVIFVFGLFKSFQGPVYNSWSFLVSLDAHLPHRTQLDTNDILRMYR